MILLKLLFVNALLIIKEGIEDISTKQANQILNKSDITVKSLPGYGNAELKKKEIKPSVKKNHLLRHN